MFTTIYLHRAWQQTDLHWKQSIWLHQVDYFAHNNAVTTNQNHWITVQEFPLAKTVNLWNTPISLFCHMGMVTHLHSSHFQALGSLITIVHATWHTIWIQPRAQGKDIQPIDHSSIDITSTMAVMVGLKWYHHCTLQEKSRHLQVQWACLQDYRETVQSIGWHHPVLRHHLGLLLAHLGDPQLASQRTDSSHKLNHR